MVLCSMMSIINIPDTHQTTHSSSRENTNTSTALGSFFADCITNLPQHSPGLCADLLLTLEWSFLLWLFVQRFPTHLRLSPGRPTAAADLAFTTFSPTSL